jgi:hypothetical protein
MVKVSKKRPVFYHAPDLAPLFSSSRATSKQPGFWGEFADFVPEFLLSEKE